MNRKSIKILIFSLLILTIFTTTVKAASNAVGTKLGLFGTLGILGDADNNKKIEKKDSETILKWATEKKKLSVFEKLRGDINKDGKVNSQDALLVVEYLNGKQKTPDKIHVTKVEIEASKKEIYVGETVNLKAIVKPDDATNKNVNWKSSNENVAKVNSSGKVTGIGSGTARITVTTEEDNKTAYVTITVNKKPKILSSISILNKPTKLEYFVNDTLSTSGLKIELKYSDGITETKTSGFTCSPTKLTSKGTQKITVTYNSKTTSFNVTVKEKTPIYTSSLKVNDKLLFIGNSWVVYKTKDAANKLDTSQKNGEVNKNTIITIREIKENVIKIDENKYIYYGSTAAESFKPYFTVIFKGGDGATGSMNNQYIAHGVQTELNANAFTKSGYTFDCWFAQRDDGTWRVIDKNGNDTWQKSLPSGGRYVRYNNKTSVAGTADPGHSVTLYAQWKKVEEKVYTFNGTQYKIAVTKAKVDDTLNKIKNKGLYQNYSKNLDGNGTYELDAKCDNVSNYYIAMLLGKADGSINYKTNLSTYEIPSSISKDSGSKTYEQMRTAINNGKVIRLHVKNYVYNSYWLQHWVVVIGYKQSKSNSSTLGLSDLLIIDSYHGKLIAGGTGLASKRHGDSNAIICSVNQ